MTREAWDRWEIRSIKPVGWIATHVKISEAEEPLNGLLATVALATLSALTRRGIQRKIARYEHKHDFVGYEIWFG